MKIHAGWRRRGEGGLRREKILDVLEFAPGLGAELFGPGQRARLAQLFQLEQHRRQPGHAQRGARALATVRNVADIGGFVRAHGVLDLFQLLLGLLVKQIHQFAHAFRVAVGQIRQPGHFHRRFLGRSGNRLGDCGGSCGIRQARLAAGRMNLRRPAFDDAAHIRRADGLGQIIVHAGGEAFFAVRLACACAVMAMMRMRELVIRMRRGVFLPFADGARGRPSRPFPASSCP